MQVTLPNGGITTLDEHEVLSFADVSGLTLPAVPTLHDPKDEIVYLIAVKLDQIPAAQ